MPMERAHLHHSQILNAPFSSVVRPLAKSVISNAALVALISPRLERQPSREGWCFGKASLEEVELKEVKVQPAVKHVKLEEPGNQKGWVLSLLLL